MKAINCIFIILLAVILFLIGYSCSKNEEDLPAPHKLKFSARVYDAVQMQVSTRAGVDNPWVNGDEAGLFVKNTGRLLSENSIYRGADNMRLVYSVDCFLPETDMYVAKYPENDDNIDYIAYYPYKERDEQYNIPVDVSIQHYPEKIDLLYSDNKKGLSKNGTATPDLLFSRQLSRLVLDVEMADGTEISNTRVTIAGMKTKASFSLINAILTVDSSSDGLIEMNTSITDGKARVEAVVLPVANVAGIALQIVANGKIYDIILSEKTNINSIRRGMVYNYKVRLTKDDATVYVNGYNEWPMATHGKFSEGTVQVTHTVPVSWLNTSYPRAGDVRNYTILYSKQYKVAYWVAYPMYADFMGDVSRTEYWKQDPELLIDYQPDLAKSWVQEPIAYSRGHQIPSADRTSSTAINRTTFYYSNMTPQNQSLNGNQWAKLEDQVRKWCMDTDTLYVVTGILLPESSELFTYAEDRKGNKAAVPIAYYKAIAKKVNDKYYTIGYKMGNHPVSGSFNNYRVTVTSLEKESGLVFFPHITDSSVKDYIDKSVWN